MGAVYACTATFGDERSPVEGAGVGSVPCSGRSEADFMRCGCEQAVLTWPAH